MRVPVKDYENKDAYEYFTGIDDTGEPRFEKGESGFNNACELLEKPVGEMSFMYSEYLQEWLVSYVKAGPDAIVVRCAKDIWGPYSPEISITKDFPSEYGAFMNPRYVSEDGKKIAFMMSMWSPIYNVSVMEMELVK